MGDLHCGDRASHQNRLSVPRALPGRFREVRQ
jgi:hypothetical protein